jgi:Aldo/keto reductase family
METRRLGTSDLRTTPIGIGAWAIAGGGWNGSMGPQNESDSVPAIHAALDHGLNWIDTAALYGLGHSETVVARALKGRSPRPYEFTKCERVWDAQGTSEPASTRSRFDENAKTVLVVCEPMSSTCIRSIGPNPTLTSKKGGRRWPGYKKQARFATSEFHTLVSLRWGGPRPLPGSLRFNLRTPSLPAAQSRPQR